MLNRVALAFLLGVCGLHAGSITFSEQNFFTGWSDTMITNQNLTSSSYVAVSVSTGGSTGGTPSWYRQETHTLVQTSSSSLAAARWFARDTSGAFDYSPSSQGAISFVDFSYDLLNIANPVPGYLNGLVGYGLGIAQRDSGNVLHYYTSYFGDVGGSSWTSYSHTGRTAFDFVEVLDSGPYPHINNSSHPDFSSSGSTIQFGYMVANGISGSFTSKSGIDNWNVTITNAVPEPASAVLLGSALAGLGLLGAMRRRRELTLPCKLPHKLESD